MCERLPGACRTVSPFTPQQSSHTHPPPTALPLCTPGAPTRAPGRAACVTLTTAGPAPSRPELHRLLGLTSCRLRIAPTRSKHGGGLLSFGTSLRRSGFGGSILFHHHYSTS